MKIQYSIEVEYIQNGVSGVIGFQLSHYQIIKLSN